MCERVTHSVMPGLGPGIPLREAHCPPKRDGRDKPGHDVERLDPHAKRGVIHPTATALASSSGGGVSPSASAVAVLMTKSNSVGSSTGRSAGFTPPKIRLT